MNRATERFQNPSRFELGTCSPVSARFRGSEAELGLFLADVYCLGVKDAFYRQVNQADYDSELLDLAGFNIGQKIPASPDEMP